MKTKIKTVKRQVMIQEKAFVLELTQNELAIIVASIGRLTEGSIKDEILIRKLPMVDDGYESGDNYKIYIELKKLLEQ